MFANKYRIYMHICMYAYLLLVIYSIYTSISNTISISIFIFILYPRLYCYEDRENQCNKYNHLLKTYWVSASLGIPDGQGNGKLPYPQNPLYWGGFKSYACNSLKLIILLFILSFCFELSLQAVWDMFMLYLLPFPSALFMLFSSSPIFDVIVFIFTNESSKLFISDLTDKY